MPARRLVIVLAILLIPSTALADGHRADFFGGFSFARGSTLWGGHFAASATTQKIDGRFVKFIGDLSIHRGEGTTLTTVLGGVGKAFASREEAEKHVVSALGLVGFTRGGGNTDGAIGVGVSYDFVPNRSATGWAFRGQVDQIIRPGDAKSFTRGSIGVVYRWITD